MSEFNETLEDDGLGAILGVQIDSKRADGQTIITFSIKDDRAFNDAVNWLGAFRSLLAEEEGIEHVLKFHDTLQYQANRQYAEQIYKIEMRLREALSFIFVDTYGIDLYDLLRDLTVNIASKEAPDQNYLKTHHENEFFFLLFSQYVNLNERKLPSNWQELYGLIAETDDFGGFKTILTSKPIANALYAEFLARIKDRMTPIEKLRNCVAHNRTIPNVAVQQYKHATEALLADIDAFFDAVVKKLLLLFVPSCFRRFFPRLTQLLLAELLRPRRATLQAALAPEGDRCRIFRRPGLFRRHRSARRLPRDGFENGRRELDRIEHLRFWSRSFFHAGIIASVRIECKLDIRARAVRHRQSNEADHMARFYGYFISAYGTFWLLLHALSIVAQGRIDMGPVGYCGFPIVALIYAMIRMAASAKAPDPEPDPLIKLKRQVNKEAQEYRDLKMQEKLLRELPDPPESQANPISTDIKPMP